MTTPVIPFATSVAVHEPCHTSTVSAGLKTHPGIGELALFAVTKLSKPRTLPVLQLQKVALKLAQSAVM